MTKERLDRMVDKVLGHNPKTGGVLGVIAGAPDKPLVIGDVELSCYVLENEERVLSQRGVLSGLGAARNKRPGDAGGELVVFLSKKWVEPFINKELMLAVNSPIRFANPSGGGVAFGYSATMLPALCRAIVEADRAGKTTARQARVVERAWVLLGGLAEVGIVALVDEATGYQRVRAERALATILERYIDKELQPWTRTFPIEFYLGICKLKGWEDVRAVKRPSVFGHYTNDFVYARLAPGVLEELRCRNPTLPGGGRAHRHHQWFTPDLGHPRLREHLEGVMALMRVSSSWDDFKIKLDKAYPKYGDTLMLDVGGVESGATG